MKFIGGCLCLCGIAALSIAQQNSKPAFEVVSIKPARAVPLRSETLSMIRIDQSQVNISSISALDLLVMAFRSPASQIDGPSWLANKAYEIRAKLPESASADAMPDMLQTACVDRLGLTFHRESRERPVYSLEVVKGGPTLTAAPATPDPAPSGANGTMWTPLGQAQMIADGQGPPTLTGKGFRLAFINGQMEFQFSTIHDLIAFISVESDRPIVDNTALKGSYQIKVTPPMGEPIHVRVEGTPSDPHGPLDTYSDSLAKMGLKLSSSKAPVDMIVIDRMNESPTEN